MRRGMSLIEIIVVVAIFAGVVGLSVVNFSSAPSRAGAMGLAEDVSEELRRARQRAIAEQQPVAIAFPSNTGTTPLSRGLYTLVGEDAPRIDSVYRYDAGYGDTATCLGEWGTPDSSAPEPLTDGDNFDANAWLASVSDPALVFLPSGVVKATFDSHDGRFAVLVSNRFGLSGGLGVDSAYRPRTIWIDPLGVISNVPGVPLGLVEGEAGSTAGAALPPALPAVANDAPVLVDILSQPTFQFGIYDHLGAGVDGSLREGEYVTFEVTATDPTGGPLVSRWNGAGTFSSATDGRMEWDEDDSVWRSFWSWTPPRGQPSGTVYDLECVVTDAQGNSVSSNASGLSPRIALSPEDVIGAQIHLSTGDGSNVVMNLEGHISQRFPHATQSPSPMELQRDGTSFIHYEIPSGGVDDIYSRRLDGLNSGWIASGRHPRLSPSGTRLVYTRPSTPTSSGDLVSWCDLDGTLMGTYDPNPGVYKRYPAIWDDGVSGVYRIAVHSGAGVTNPSRIFYFETNDPAGTHHEISVTNGTIYPCFSPDGAYLSYIDGGDLWVVDSPPAGNTPRQITNLGDLSRCHVWSPDSNRVAFFRESAGNVHTLHLGVLDPGVTGFTNTRALSRADFQNSRGLSWVRP